MQLTFLDLSYNAIERLAADLEKCVSLTDLHLSNNQLEMLPESFGEILQKEMYSDDTVPYLYNKQLRRLCVCVFVCVRACACLSGYLLKNYLTNFCLHSLHWKLTKMRHRMNLNIDKLMYFYIFEMFYVAFRAPSQVCVPYGFISNHIWVGIKPLFVGRKIEPVCFDIKQTSLHFQQGNNVIMSLAIICTATVDFHCLIVPDLLCS